MERVHEFEKLYAVVDYHNTPEAQASLSSTYTELMEVSEGFGKALQTQGIKLNVPRAFYDFVKAHFDYQNNNLQNFLTMRRLWFEAELKYWRSKEAIRD